jgi:predicted DNA-binding transcriptional regulator YafY
LVRQRHLPATDNPPWAEKAPENTQFLDDIISAIDKQYAIRFHYRTPYGDEKDMELVPAFLRLFHQRWYVIGNLIGQDGQPPKPRSDGSDFHPRVLPFDRISYLEIVCEKQLLSKKTREQLMPDKFYEGCYGIMRQQNLPPRKIRIRAFYPENNYIDEVPLHESQTKIRDAADDSYTDYELFLSPTCDFEQELLWHGRKIIVLSPDDFRQEMIGILKDMVRSYETGENTVEE